MKKLAKVFLVASLAATPLYGHAWNLICGVSIGAFKAATMDTKWEADSAAIKGMSEFYGAIAELQSINIENLSIAGKKAGELPKIAAALARFKASNDQLTQATTKANQLIATTGPADNMGIESMGLWKQLSDRNTRSIKALEANTLPELEDLHGAIEITHRIGNVGMRASLLHLNQHKTHHTAGGPSVKF